MVFFLIKTMGYLFSSVLACHKQNFTAQDDDLEKNQWRTGICLQQPKGRL